MSDFPVSRALARAALNAIHEAYGTPITRCLHVNRVVREYPDIPDEALEELLSFHDRRECECVKIAAECSVATEFIRKYPDYTDAQLVCMMRFHDDRVCECRERLEKDIGKYNA